MYTGLGELHDKKGVVHRDIVPWNILIQSEAPDGSRGILNDFSCAALVDSKPVSPRPETTPVRTPSRNVFSSLLTSDVGFSYI
jgi:serine/threonine protein kinase